MWMTNNPSLITILFQANCVKCFTKSYKLHLVFMLNFNLAIDQGSIFFQNVVVFEFTEHEPQAKLVQNKLVPVPSSQSPLGQRKKPSVTVLGKKSEVTQVSYTVFVIYFLQLYSFILVSYFFIRATTKQDLLWLIKNAKTLIIKHKLYVVLLFWGKLLTITILQAAPVLYYDSPYKELWQLKLSMSIFVLCITINDR